MSDKLNEFRQLKSKMLQGYDEEGKSKQHSKSKMTTRERIEKLFDIGTFIESGIFANTSNDIPYDAVVTGYGQINGRLVYVAAQDYSVASGTLGILHCQKIVNTIKTALKVGAPIIYIYDSNGVRLNEGIDALSGMGEVFYYNTLASGVIPQISIVMGTCAGAMTSSCGISDFVFMIDNESEMYINGPQLLSAIEGKDISNFELGGSMTHNSKSGVAHFSASNEMSCIEQVRCLLSYLPQNNKENSETYNCNDDLNRVCEDLNNVISDDIPYDMKNVIRQVADENIFFEVSEFYAKNIITGFIRLGGQTIGVVANEPLFCDGIIDINSSCKASRFIRICDLFNIPILTFVDTDGIKKDTHEELNGLIKHYTKLIFAYSEATVPMVTVVTKKAFGSSYIGMGSKHLGVDLVYAWPSAEIAIMKAESIADIVNYDDIKNANNVSDERKKKIEEYKKSLVNPYAAANRGFVDDIIEPSMTRKILITAFDMLLTKKVDRTYKKYGNIPL